MDDLKIELPGLFHWAWRSELWDSKAPEDLKLLFARTWELIRSGKELNKMLENDATLFLIIKVEYYT